MTSKSTTKTNQPQECALKKKQSIPVQLTDLTIFDNSYAFMKERFAEEMKRINQQMIQFSTDIMEYYGQTSSDQSGLQSPRPEDISSNLDLLVNSPLVQGEGADKSLKLQFDLSQFDPCEIKVKVENDVLYISASHREKNNGSSLYREYNREYMLPRGTDPEQVVSSLSRDGVLTVQAPLPQALERILIDKRSYTD